jgi:hypothetical protein
MIALVTPNNLPGRTAAAPPSEGASALRDGPMRDNMMGPRREQICRDLYAGKAGELAFLEAKLSLDARQTPLFDRWKQASLDIARQHESDCLGKAPRRAELRGHRATVVDRMTMEEDLLKKRLADIQAERPALTALYNALTQVQKEEFSRSNMRMAGPLHMMLGMMDRPRPGMGMGMMNRPHPGMMRQGPMSAPGQMDGPPEPPPAPAQ